MLCKKTGRSKMLGFFTNLPPYLIGIGVYRSAHYCRRGLQMLGNAVKRMPPSYVKV
jgi:hypothetical protein